MASIPNAALPLVRFPPSPSFSLRNLRNIHVVFPDPRRLRWNPGKLGLKSSVRASAASSDPKDERADEAARALQGLIDALPPVVVLVKRNIGSKFAISLYIAFAFLAIIVRKVMPKKQTPKHQGSVADLVTRGQLRSDRRGISKPLKYEDPFNNPLVKVHRNDSTVEVCGKIYRLAPVTLTEEQQSVHQKRRSRAYQWTRPKVFLKEGDSVPPDVDPDTVRWIPSNHPFATTVTDIDEDMAQNNVSQKHGVPSRIRAEHEALQKKLQAIEQTQRANGIAVNPFSQGLERPVETPRPHEQLEPNLDDDQQYRHITPVLEPKAGSSENADQQ